MTSSVLRLWLDGADVATLYAANTCTGAAATSRVGCWKDKSGQVNNATQGTSADRPILTTVLSRGVPGFDGSTDSLSLASPAGLPTGSTSSTEFVVASLTDPTPGSSGYRAVLDWGATGTGQARALFKPSSSTAVTFDARFTSSSSPGSWSTTGPSLVAAEAAGAGTTIRTGLNAGPWSPATSVSFTTGTTSGFVGQNVASTDRWYGPVDEVLVFTGTLTTADRRTVEDYLARKWAVTVTPQAPTSVVATAGDSQASVQWVAPAWNGGATVTTYTAAATPTAGTGYATAPTQTCTTASTGCTVTGLTNGLTYTVTVTATNSVGVGATSSSATVIPYPALLASTTAQVWLDGTDPDGDGVPEGMAENCATATPCTSLSNLLKRWADKSGHGRDAVQSTGSMAGTWTPATGLVTFTANGYYQAAGVPTGPGVTAFTVASAAASTFNTSGWLVGGRAADGWVLHPNQGAAGVKFFGIDSSGYNSQTTNTTSVTPTTAITNPHVWDGEISGGTSSQTLDVGVDGAGSSTTSSSSTRAAANVTLTIGADDLDLTNRRGNGAFREIVVFNTALTTTERRTIREYLARKWAVSLTPQAPTGLGTATVTAGDTQATASWTAPGWDGGSPVTSYTLTAVPTAGTGYATAATQTCATASTTCTVTGLTDGITYTLTVAATNSTGTGPPSTPSTVIPYPSAVLTSSALKLWLDGADTTTLYASPGCTGATASSVVGCWKDKSTQANNTTQSTVGNQPTLATVASRSVPSFDGSTSYLSLSPSLLPTGTATSTTFAVATMTDPSPGSSNFRMLLGWGNAASGQARQFLKNASSSAVVVDANTTGITVPGTWTSLPHIVVGNHASAAVTSWFDGGIAAGPTSASFTTATTGATVGRNMTSSQFYWSGAVPEIVVLNTTPTAAERRTVEDYLARKWEATITPQAPTAAAGTSGNGQVTVSWTAPGWDGGGSVTGYTATSSPGGLTCTTAATSCTITGLTNGTAYTFTVTATNSIGTGPASTASSSVTPAGPPGAPTSPAATAGDTTASVTWTAPASNGGSTITSYTATASPTAGTGYGSLPAQNCTAAASPCTITSLTNGITYTVTVTATNTAGTGSASTSTTVIPYPSGAMTPAALKLWLDSADTTTMYAASSCSGAPASSSVGCWTDKSSSGNNFSQSTAGNQPSLVTVNGRNVPSFDGTSDRLAGSASLLPNGSSTSSAFAVAKLTDPTPSSSSFRTVFEHGTANSGQSRVLEKNQNSSAVGAESYGTVVTDGSTWGSSAQVFGGQWSSGAVTLWSSGRPAATSNATISTGTNFATVGSENGSYFWQGPIAEVIVLNTAPSTTQRRDIEEYLARKWGTTITASPPQSPTATAGSAQATVSWTAPPWDGGSSVTSYTVTSSPGNKTCTTSTTACTVTGLTTGQTYTFTVTATNTIGTGPSSQSNSVTP